MHRVLSPTTIRIPVGDQPGCPCSICEDDAAMSDNHQNTDIASPTMSVNGSLRDRIAKVIWKVFQNTPPIDATDDEWESWWNDSTQEEKALCYAQADAVIRELKLIGSGDLTYDHAYPRDYTDRQLWESTWRKIDGLAEMVAGTTRMYPDAHPDDIAEVVAAWTRHTSQ